MGTKKTTTTSQQSATTTPQLPEWGQAAIGNYYDQYNKLAKNPAAVTVDASPLQQKAYGAAGDLGIPDRYGSAINMAHNVANSAAPQLGGYSPIQANTVNMRGYDAPQLGNASTIDMGGILGAIGNPAQATAATVGDFQQAGGGRASQYRDEYLNPYLNDVVKSAMADYDEQAGITRAGYEAQGALNKGFGGSGYYLGGAQLEGELARGRAATDAGLRSDAFKFATEAGAGDAGRVTQASIANSQADAQRALAEAQMAQQAGLFNAGALNDRSGLLAQLGFNTQAYNADAKNNFALAQGGYDNQAAQFGANAFNQGQQFNASTLNDMAKYNQGFNYQTDADNANLTMQQRGLQGNMAGLLGTLGSAQGADVRANIGLQSQLGDQQYQQALMEQLAPYTQQQLLAQLLNPGSVMNLATGQKAELSGTGTSKESGGFLQSLLGPMGQLGAAAITKSERRVKRNIVKLSEEPDGLGVFRYNYIWDAPEEPPRFGVMVDEVQAIRPWALGPVVDGIQTVDYAKLEAR